jgi:hypothetical protein
MVNPADLVNVAIERLSMIIIMIIIALLLLTLSPGARSNDNVSWAGSESVPLQRWVKRAFLP